MERTTPKFWIWTSKIIPYLWLLHLFWPIKINFLTPPFCTVQPVLRNCPFSVGYGLTYSFWCKSVIQSIFLKRLKTVRITLFFSNSLPNIVTEQILFQVYQVNKVLSIFFCRWFFKNFFGWSLNNFGSGSTINSRYNRISKHWARTPPVPSTELWPRPCLALSYDPARA